MTKRGWLEMFVLYAIVMVINLLWTPNHLGYPNSVLHPYLLPVLLTAARYGIPAGLWASAVGTLLMVVLSGWDFRLPFHITSSGAQLTPANLLDQPRNLVLASWILLSAVIGAVLEKVRKERDGLAAELDELKQVHKETKTRSDILATENQELREKVLGKGDTVATVYEMARRLTTLRGQDLYHACLELVEKFVGSQRSSIYLLSEDRRQFELAESRGEVSDGKVFPKFLRRGDPLVEKCVEENRTVSVRELFTAQRSQQQLPAVLCAPLSTEEEGVLGVLVIEELPFEALNSQTVSVLELLADWTSRSLAVVQKFERGDETDNSTTSLSASLGKRRLSRTALNTLCHYEPTLRMALRILADKESHDVARWNAASLLSCQEVTLEIEEETLQKVLVAQLRRGKELGSLEKSLPRRREFLGCRGLLIRLRKARGLTNETALKILRLYVNRFAPNSAQIMREIEGTQQRALKLLKLKLLAERLPFLKERFKEVQYCLGMNRPPREQASRDELLLNLQEDKDHWTRRLAQLAAAELGLIDDCSEFSDLVESDSPFDTEVGFLAMGQVDLGVLKVWPEPENQDALEILERVREEFAQSA